MILTRTHIDHSADVTKSIKSWSCRNVWSQKVAGQRLCLGLVEVPSQKLSPTCLFSPIRDIARCTRSKIFFVWCYRLLSQSAGESEGGMGFVSCKIVGQDMSRLKGRKPQSDISILEFLCHRPTICIHLSFLQYPSHWSFLSVFSALVIHIFNAGLANSHDFWNPILKLIGLFYPLVMSK